MELFVYFILIEAMTYGHDGTNKFCDDPAANQIFIATLIGLR